MPGMSSLCTGCSTSSMSSGSSLAHQRDRFLRPHPAFASTRSFASGRAARIALSRPKSSSEPSLILSVSYCPSRGRLLRHVLGLGNGDSEARGEHGRPRQSEQLPEREACSTRQPIVEGKVERATWRGAGPEVPIQAAISDGAPGSGSGRHAAASQKAIMDSSETP